MPILTVTTWPTLGDEKSQLLIEKLTDVVHETTGAPLDKITVLIQEVPQSRWGEGGVLGDNPEFPTLSRRKHKAG
ncbi:tautomerase family protein [Comamonas testosteroni]|uniref:tautomerase family protein n=1 Tax=Comamonas testosteroni TaxID=285 RepID=UPI0023AA51F4|nr:tautomerase family protein [Comamonas testosteroni]WEE75417.1 tautomerase family protein [Comamonas testosteroni]